MKFDKFICKLTNNLASKSNKMQKGFNESCDELLEACWKNYKKVGMKKKGKRVVPDCVPK